jgi:hypothetical protein
VFVRRGFAAALVVALVVAMAASSAAAPERSAKPPRIVAASMLDADRDARADRIRLTYSVPVRHAADRDGRYPFRVAGYRIRSAGAASGNRLVLLLGEKARPDPKAHPAIRYVRTRSQPVVAWTGLQAAGQLFRGTRAHRRTPPPGTITAPPATTTPATTVTTPPTTTPTTTPTAAADADRDGYPDARDCAPRDAKIHPGAPDLPDLAFVDSNCDAIDGTEADAIFASPKGSDADPGTKEKPKRQIQAAVAAAAGRNRYVLAAVGSYAHVTAASGVDVYGGYDPDSWKRQDDAQTSIVGAPEGVLADGARDVLLQLLAIRGVNNGASAYGIRAINGANLRLQGADVSAGPGAAGAAGASGATGRSGSPGQKGANGACDSNVKATGGAGGASPVGRDGGKGGDGKYASAGGDGEKGIVGTPGGKGGWASRTEGGQGYAGDDGQHGSNGAPGSAGQGGTNATTFASATWRGRGGVEGGYGAPGNGGGGGGAGGAQTGVFVIDGTGDGGGGGGGGGEGGRGGGGGQPGGGSFGVYLYSSSLAAEKSSIRAGSGGAGGRGGDGGPGGQGGAGGPRNLYCYKEVGPGGSGGRGGNGGQGGGGGGGAGGPSVGVFKIGSATGNLTLTETVVTAGAPGPGGATGAGGYPAAKAESGLAQAVYP